MSYGITENNRLKTIEIDKHEPIHEKSETSCIVDQASSQEVFDQLKDHLEYLGMLPDDYFRLSMSGSERIPENWRDFNSVVSFGGSDGIYLDIYLNTVEGTQKFAAGKTLNESTESFIWISRIAAECNLMLNGNGCEMFLPKDVEKVVEDIRQAEAEAAFKSDFESDDWSM